MPRYRARANPVKSALRARVGHPFAQQIGGHGAGDPHHRPRAGACRDHAGEYGRQHEALVLAKQARCARLRRAPGQKAATATPRLLRQEVGAAPRDCDTPALFLRLMRAGGQGSRRCPSVNQRVFRGVLRFREPPHRPVRVPDAPRTPSRRRLRYGFSHPMPRSSCAVSNKGSPTTLEWLPDRKRMKASARPWMP